LFKKLTSLFIVFVLSGFVATSGISQAAESKSDASISVTSSVDKIKVSQDELITFTVEINGAIGKLPEIKLPDLDKDFIVVSTSKQHNISFGSAQGKLAFSLKYLLKAKEVGTFSIEPVIVDYKGKKYKTETINIEVTKSEKPQEDDEKLPIEFEEGEEVIL